ncbi:MAG: TMEM43 family protein [Rhizobiaceae bacterium]|nr:TMEM43 family protein [Rhizobiaceae bacterium]
MSDSVREVSSISWFGRLKRSVGGVIIGLILIVAMVVLLFWNEGRAVVTAKSLAEGAGIVVSVPTDSVDPSNNGRLVHVTGMVSTAETPADPDFGISAAGIRLRRSAEMYQWRQETKSETETKLGGGQETVTTYSYSRGWYDRPIDSSGFKQPQGHANPPMQIRSHDYQVSQASMGAFTLRKPILDRIGASDTLALSPGQAGSVRDAYQGTAQVSIVDGGIYLGRNPTSPAIGDYRIGYRLAPAGEISIVGRQSGSGFEPYQTEAGDALLMVDAGLVPADKMFSDAEAGNTILTWILRAVGLVVLFIGFTLFVSPLGVVADVIPFLGSVVRLGTGLAAFVLALLVGVTTIAVAWFWYRPLFSLMLIAITLVVAGGLTWLGRRKEAPAAAPAAPKFGR